LVDVGGGRRGRRRLVIGRLRRVFSSALGRGNAPAAELSDAASATRSGADEPARRIEAARRRLKATIPPPED
jgi:hypothetical protein